MKSQTIIQHANSPNNSTLKFLPKAAAPEQAKNASGYKESGIGAAGFFVTGAVFCLFRSCRLR